MSKRSVFVLRKNSWVRIELQNVKRGDRFVVHNNDSDPVIDSGGGVKLIASSDSYRYDKKNDVWAVKVQQE